MEHATAGEESRQIESIGGDAAVESAEPYVHKNIRSSEEQSVGVGAPAASEDRVTAAEGDQHHQVDDAQGPDDPNGMLNATEQGDGQQDINYSNAAPKASLQNVSEARSSVRQSTNQSARSGWSDRAHEGDAGDSQRGSGAGTGSPSGPPGDVVIDMDGSQHSPSASARNNSDPGTRISNLERSRPTPEELQAYWHRLKAVAPDQIWEGFFNPSKLPLGSGNECCLFCDRTGPPWRLFDWRDPDYYCAGLGILGINIGLMTMLNLGVIFDTDPCFFRDATLFHQGLEVPQSNQDGDVWWHMTCGSNVQTIPSFSVYSRKTGAETMLSFYWPKTLGSGSIVLVLMKNKKIVELEHIKGLNLLQTFAWNVYKQRLAIAFRSAEAAIKFTTLSDDGLSSRLANAARNRGMERYLCFEKDPSALSPTYGRPLRLARFLMQWMQTQIENNLQRSTRLAVSCQDLIDLLGAPTMGPFQSLCTSLTIEIWQYTTALAEKEATRPADRAIEDPTFDTFRALNQCRGLVKDLQSMTRQSQASGPTLAKLRYQRELANTDDPNHPDFVTAFEKEAQNTQDGLTVLENGLKETFTLLVQAVTVVDSDANKKAASRASLLTLLAALYLPATLATGIFGMNVKLFTDDANAADWRPVIYTFLVVLAPSVAFIGYIFLPRGKQKSARW